MSFLRRRRTDHSSLQERRGDAGSAADGGPGSSRLSWQTRACDSSPAGGPAPEAQLIRAAAPGSNLEQLAFISRPFVLTAEQLRAHDYQLCCSSPQINLSHLFFFVLGGIFFFFF